MLQRLFPSFIPPSDVPDREAAGDPGKFFRLRRLFSAGFRTRNRNVSKREAILDDFRRIRIQYREDFEGRISDRTNRGAPAHFKREKPDGETGLGKVCGPQPELASTVHSLLPGSGACAGLPSRNFPDESGSFRFPVPFPHPVRNFREGRLRARGLLDESVVKHAGERFIGVRFYKLLHDGRIVQDADQDFVHLLQILRVLFLHA